MFVYPSNTNRKDKVILNKKLLRYIEGGKYIKFYQSKEWRETRHKVMERDNFECQRCKKEGKFHVGECVHHKVHLKDNPLLGLDKSNLITLCNSCHDKEHPEKLNNNERIEKINIPERW